MQQIINVKNLLCESIINSASKENTDFICELKNIICDHSKFHNTCITTRLTGDLEKKIKTYNINITNRLANTNIHVTKYIHTNLTNTLANVIQTINNHNYVKYEYEINKIIQNFNKCIDTLSSYNDSDKLLIREINDEQVFAFKLYNNKVYQIVRKNESNSINAQLVQLINLM